MQLSAKFLYACHEMKRIAIISQKMLLLPGTYNTWYFWN